MTFIYQSFKIIVSFSISTFLLLEIGFSQTEKCPISPTPQEIVYEDGFFVFSEKIQLYFNQLDSNSLFIFHEFNQCCKEAKISSKCRKGSIKKPCIQFLLVDTISVPINSDQGYIMSITPQHIIVEATTGQGLFYGYQSLRQLFHYYMTHNVIHNDSTTISPKIPCGVIKDYPILTYRGWMDDISRGPIPTISFIKQLIRTLSAFKLNCFTLYTENTFKTQSHGDYAPKDAFTTLEIKEIENYAQKYHVELFGNQQCLAHSRGILQNPKYQHLADTRDCFNPGKEQTYQFFEDILSEIGHSYTSQFFNINCDETEGLGKGNAKQYVDSVGGASVAYAMHINRIFNILQKKNKRIMMWGDIASRSDKILELLPKEIVMIAWSYVPANDFNGIINPINKANYDFMIAPGVSCWGTIFPDMNNYITNISNFVRDGARNGCLGMLNTAWDDSGESLFNTTWHGMCWGAEMSWKPITHTEPEKAQEEVDVRFADFNRKMNYHLFDYYSDSLIIADKYMEISNLNKLTAPNITLFKALWEPIFPFYPNNTDSSAWNKNISYKKLIDTLLRTDFSTQHTKSKMYNQAIAALLRAKITVDKNLFRIHLSELFKNLDNNNIQKTEKEAILLIKNIGLLKKVYSQLWDIENRAYWKENNLKKYDLLQKEIENYRLHTFFETNLSKDKEQHISLRTLIQNEYPIYYTIDGSEPDTNSPIYSKPFPIFESCTVKSRVYKDSTTFWEGEQYFIHHKGIGHLKCLHTEYSKYLPEYSAGGNEGLVDGITGSAHFNDGKWQGYQGCDIDMELDILEQQSIDSISFRYIENLESWIKAPDTVNIMVSEDGREFAEIKSDQMTLTKRVQENGVYEVNVKGIGIKTRYLRVIIRNGGVLPAGHSGAGNDSYLFVDEIIVN